MAKTGKKNRMVPDVVIKFELNGRPKVLDYRQVPFVGWTELKRALSLTPRTLMQAITDLDVEAIAAVMWLERKQRERRLPFGDVIRELRDDEPEWELTDVLLDGHSTYGDEDDEDLDEEEEDTDADPPRGAATGVTPS